MTQLRIPKLLACLMSLWMVVYPIKGITEDIDIFVGSSAGSSGNPNVLIVLDNTANWSRQSQQWPGGEQQGQSEVAAIKEVINSLDSSVNVGLMEFVTGSGNGNGGFVRLPIRPLTATNKNTFSTTMDAIYADVTGPDEKRSANAPYGNLIADAFNYFAGINQSQSGASTLSSLVVGASESYTTAYSKFKSPLSCGTSCAKNFVIFITNPSASGPDSDSATNTAALTAAGGSATQLGLPNFTTTSVPSYTELGASSACYSSQSACISAGSAAYSGANFAASCSDTSTYPGGCTCGTTQTTALACPSGSSYYSVTGSGAQVVTTGASSKKTYTQNVTSSTPVGSVSGFPASGESWSCSGTSTVESSVAQNGGKYQYNLKCTTTSTGTTALGTSSSCYASASACQTGSATQFSGYTSYSCTATTAALCSAGQAKFNIRGVSSQITNTPTGTFTSDTNPFNADEWARLMYLKGVPVSTCANQTISTYTVDVYNKQPNAQHTALMLSMAKAGGGRYFNATSKSAISQNLKEIFKEIQSVNSTFASASLPISATNRAQNNNQVFIGMFRPDPDTKPRWFGNVKQYKLIQNGNNISLGDANDSVAINPLTGFLKDCSVSTWTEDSGDYWKLYSQNPGVSQVKPDASSTCATSAYDVYSDSPDGPRVEKGSVAEMIRRGNNAPATNTSPTWAVNRNVYTSTAAGTGSVLAFNASNTGLSDTTVRWVRGEDTEDENGNGAADATKTRASIHGDVVHSRPLPVNYCGTGTCAASLITYYGANDGTLRAVDSVNGNENWAFVAPEFWTRLDRLRTGDPKIDYASSTIPNPTAKNYFFDGPIGIYQNSNGASAPDKTWIYPTMRRGGRMLYALNVSTAGAAPSIMWKFGCPNLSNDTGCTTDSAGASASGMGQTWSTPNIASIKTSSSTSVMVAAVGGGYDQCEDADAAAPSCSTTKGNKVYVLDAEGSGGNTTILAQFDTLRSVTADVSFVDMNGDGKPDYAYVGDTGGNLYRISFAAYSAATNAYTPLTASKWSIKRIGYTTGAGRKFQFTPAVFATQGKVYVALGSGDRERPLITNYPYTTPVLNRFYVYRDCLPDVVIGADGTLTSSTDATNNLDDATLMNGTTATGTTSCTAPQTLASNCSTNKGWYVDLNNGTGEQTVTSAIISGGLVTFSTNRPLPPAAGTCSNELGEARGYFLNLFNGSGAIGSSASTCGESKSAIFVGGGLPPSPVVGVVNVNGDGKTFTRVIIGAVQKTGGNSSYIDSQKAPTQGGVTRKKVYDYTKGGN